MKKSKRQVIASVMLTLVLLTVIALIAVLGISGEDLLYRKWQHPGAMSLIGFAAQHFPSRILQVLHLSDFVETYVAEDQAIRDSLLTSGYLTKVEVNPVDPKAFAPPTMYQLMHVARRAGVKVEISMVEKSAALILICRPQDVSFCRNLIEAQKQQISANKAVQRTGASGSSEGTDRTPSTASSGR